MPCEASAHISRAVRLYARHPRLNCAAETRTLDQIGCGSAPSIQNVLPHLRLGSRLLPPLPQPEGLTKSSRSVEHSETTGNRYKIQSDSGGVAEAHQKNINRYPHV